MMWKFTQDGNCIWCSFTQEWRRTEITRSMVDELVKIAQVPDGDIRGRGVYRQAYHLLRRFSNPIHVMREILASRGISRNLVKAAVAAERFPETISKANEVLLRPTEYIASPRDIGYIHLKHLMEDPTGGRGLVDSLLEARRLVESRALNQLRLPSKLL